MKIIKILFVSILTFFVLFTSTAQKTKKIKNDLKENKFLGKIKIITSTTYSVIDSFGLLQKKDILDLETVSYNEKGNKVEWVHERKEGNKFYDKRTYKYDSKGNEIEVTRYNSDGNLMYKWNKKYDDVGNIIEKNTYESDGSLSSKSTYKYDDLGNMVLYNWFNSDGSLYEKRTYNYDTIRNNMVEYAYSSDGSYNGKWIYTYDENGNIIESYSCFDHKGNKIESNIPGCKSTYKYDNNGNKIEGSSYSGGKFTTKYDSNGNVIENIFYNKDGSLDSESSYKYIYDIKGNWIKKTDYLNSFPKCITERKIIYY